MNDLNEISVLSLNKNDIIVINLPGNPGLEIFDKLKKQAEKLFPSNQILFLCDGIKLSIIREGTEQDGSEY